MLCAQAQSPSPTSAARLFLRPPGDTDTIRPQLWGTKAVPQHWASRLLASPPHPLIPPATEMELVTRIAAGIVTCDCKLSPFGEYFCVCTKAGSIRVQGKKLCLTSEVFSSKKKK